MITIAIDGGPATGKGTLGQKLSAAYDLAYLDTGALYRTVGYTLMEKGIAADNEAQAILAAQSLHPSRITQLQENPAIRTEICGAFASKVSAIPQVRAALFDFQRQFAVNPPVLLNGKPSKGAVLDGRDIGTVICPDADLKVYLTARAEIRAQRRFKELQSRGICVIYEDVLSDVVARDKRDRERETAPQRAAEDAFVLDTSDLTPDEVFAAVVAELKKKIGK